MTWVDVAEGKSAPEIPHAHAPKATAPNAITMAETPFCAAPATPGSNCRGGRFSSSSSSTSPLPGPLSYPELVVATPVVPASALAASAFALAASVDAGFSEPAAGTVQWRSAGVNGPMARGATARTKNGLLIRRRPRSIRRPRAVVPSNLDRRGGAKHVPRPQWVFPSSQRREPPSDGGTEGRERGQRRDSVPASR